MRKTALVLLTALVLTSCSSNPPDSTINENDVIGGQVNVEFLSSAEQWSSKDVVTENKDYYLQHAADYLKTPEMTDDQYLESLYTPDEGGSTAINFWKVGTIKNGTYAGQSMVLVRARCDGPCQPDTLRYAVDESSNHWTGLVPYSDASMGSAALQGPGTDLEASIDIPALDYPQTLSLYENDPVYVADPFSLQDPYFFGMSADQENFSTAYTLLTDAKDPSFAKYYLSNGTGCLFGETPDGMMVRYQVMPVSFGFTEPSQEKGDYSYGQPNQSGEFTLLIPNGSEVKKEEHTYVLTAGGCGFLGGCVITNEVDASDEANLVELGTITRPEAGSTVGQTVYTLSKVPELAEGATAGDVANDGNGLTAAVQLAYETYKMGAQYKDPPVTAMSMADFLKSNEVVFLKMDSGRYVLAYDQSVAPSAECGKPVIYLYPTKAEQVSVKVNNVTFSKTLPAYGNGWTVWAEPSGALKNLADGKTYPYLFWEGQSSAKVTMGEPWTLAKKDIAAKLPVALTSMGLSTKETADFMEFWLPKLQAVTTPYVQFNFEGTAAMNQVAPLSITPAPDSLLRVFMYYQGVNQAGRSMPAYSAPARTGFSVVEWGGSLY